MKFKLISNRMLSSDNKFAGYNNENRAELLEFVFPENLKDYTKTINFETTEGNFFDILDGDTYTLKNNITKYDIVSFYIEFKKQISETEYEIIKTETKRLQFRESFDVDKEISEEEINILDSLIIKIDEATKRANAISQDLEEKVANDYYRGPQGIQGIQGPKGETGATGSPGEAGQDGYTPIKGTDYFTNEDKQEIESEITSKLENQGYIKDNNYVHTDNNFTNEEKQKLSSLENYDDTKIKTDISNLKNNKQDKLIAGDNITISEDNVISAIGGGLVDDVKVNGESVVTDKVANIDLDDYAKKEYVEEEIAKFDFIKIVEELPETGLPNRTYFVPKTEQGTNDLYDEYMWVNNAWEFVGTKTIEVDLTNYVKNTDIATQTKAGIIRTSNNLATNSQGIVYALNRTISQYKLDGNNSFISKGTLENLKETWIFEDESGNTVTKNVIVSPE